MSSRSQAGPMENLDVTGLQYPRMGYHEYVDCSWANDMQRAATEPSPIPTYASPFWLPSEESNQSTGFLASPKPQKVNEYPGFSPRNPTSPRSNAATSPTTSPPSSRSNLGTSAHRRSQNRESQRAFRARQKLYMQSLEAEIQALKKQNMELSARCQKLSQHAGDEKHAMDLNGESWSVDDLYGQDFDDFLLFKEKELSEAQVQAQKMGEYTS